LTFNKEAVLRGNDAGGLVLRSKAKHQIGLFRQVLETVVGDFRLSRNRLESTPVETRYLRTLVPELVLDDLMECGGDFVFFPVGQRMACFGAPGAEEIEGADKHLPHEQNDARVDRRVRKVV